jgi:sigma-E factor negative regulatory protein RseC
MPEYEEMLEEQARVIDADETRVWVETESRSGCSSCSSRNCTTSVVASLFGVKRNRFTLNNTIQAKQGDQVVIGIPGQMIVRASVIAYLVPLISMLAMTLLSSSIGMSEGAQSLFAVAGLLLGLVVVRWRTKEGASRQSHGPRLLRVVDNGYRHVVFTKHMRS